MSDSHTGLTDHGDAEVCGKVVDVLGRFGDRWTLRVILTLRVRPHRFNELRRTVEGISQQMLTRTLKILERDGMLIRTVLPTVPPQVEYALTPLGEALGDEGARLGDWAFGRLSEIDASRERYDGEEV